MNQQRAPLPQLEGGLFFTDAGLETDMIFNHGFELPAFAAHTLLNSERGRQALSAYFRGFLELACEHESGFILDAPTWRAQPAFADELQASTESLKQSNQHAVEFVSSMRKQYASNDGPILLNAQIGPAGDAYATPQKTSAQDAQAYHSQQIGWLAQTDLDMVSAMTLTDSNEAIGIARAAQQAGLPCAISFTVETDGRLPSGEALGAAIEAVDDATDRSPAYYMINCAHPDHFAHTLDSSPWATRVRGLRCNASRQSHAQLDEATTLDAGNPVELATLYQSLADRMPWLNVFGGCCGSDLSHVARIAQALRTRKIRETAA